MAQDYEYFEVIGRDDYGCPLDKYGHHLDPDDISDNEGRQLTSPYGSLEYAVGSGDDFYCFDYAHHPNGTHLILHSVINSETGSFIQDGDYCLVTKDDAVAVAMQMIEEALEWCSLNDIRHSITGWNQDPYYFARAVDHAVNGHEPKRIKSNWRKHPLYQKGR